MAKPRYTTATATRILEEIQEGKTITKVLAQSWAPSYSTWTSWLAEDRWELRSRYDAAQRAAADIIASKRLDRIRDLEAEHDTYIDIRENTRVDTQLLRLAYDAEREWRQRVNPEAWAHKQVVATPSEEGELKGFNVIALPIKDLSGPGASIPADQAKNETETEKDESPTAVKTRAPWMEE